MTTKSPSLARRTLSSLKRAWIDMDNAQRKLLEVRVNYPSDPRSGR